MFLTAAGLLVFRVTRHDGLASARARADVDADAFEVGHSGSGSSAWSPDDRPAPSRARSASSGDYRHHDWSAETELSRRTSLGLPLDGFWRQPAQHELERDPQLAAMWRAFHARRDADADAPPLPFEPMGHRAQLIDSEGLSSAATNCEVRVLPVETHSFNCVVRVMCGGAVLYPNERQDAGYVPCQIEGGRPVRAVDDGQTDRDGDPLVDLDLERGTITVEDFAPDGSRRYRATLRIHS